MRIIIIADSLDNQRAGVHNYTRALVDALAALPNRQHEYILIRERREAGLPFKQVILGNTRLPIGYASLRLFALIPLLARRLGADAVFEPAHFGPFNLPKGILRITMIHDLTPILMPDYHPWHSQTLQRLFLPKILRKTNLILSNSQNTTCDLIQYNHTLQNKIKTLLLGRNTFFFPVREKAFLNHKKISQPYFLSVGTIEPRKNLNLLLDAFRLMAEDGNDETLLLIAGGRGWKSETFFAALEKHPQRNRIRLLGYVDKAELRELYSHALALVYPSLYEGFGFPVLEAMACRTNVITSDSSSLPEVGGDAAYYIRTDDAEGLAGLMRELTGGKDDAEARRALGLERAALFSWMDYAKGFEEAIPACLLMPHGAK